jgi:hypothetical protein
MGRLSLAAWLTAFVLLSGVVAVGAGQVIKAWNVTNIVDIENVPAVTHDPSLYVSSSELLDIPLTQILWGTLQNGTSKSATIYAKNMGDTATTIRFVTGNFTVADPDQYLVVSAVISQPVLAPGESTPIVVTLQAMSTAPSLQGLGFDTAILAE